MKPKSIVHKARAYVLLILVFLCSAALLEWRGLLGVEAEIGDLSDSTAPLLSETTELSRIGIELRALSEATRTVPDMAALDALRRQLDTLLKDVGARIQSFAPADDMIEQASANLSALLDKQAQVLLARDQIEQMTLLSLEHLRHLTRALEVKEQPQLLALMVQSDIAPDLSRSAAIDDLLTVSEMKVSLARLSMLASGLAANSATDPLATRAQVLREVGVLASRVARLGDVSLRQELGQSLSLYREAMLGESGMISAINALSQWQRQRDDAFADTSKLVDSLTNRLGQTSSQVAAQFEDAAVATKKTIAQLLNQNLVMTFTLVLLVAIFAWSVIERGLVSRIVGLTDHVRRLAQGDFSTPVSRTGEDEVGEIENAVEHSRLTSAALRRSNEELERFAYAAAHDLRSPLRAVSDLVDWTQEDFGASLPQGVQENLRLISGRVTRLSEHLAALLEYARAGQAEDHVSVFSLEDFVEELRSDFLQSDSFSIDVAPGSERFETFATPIKTILLNLVSNAIKHHDRPGGRIELSSRFEGAEIVLCVQDDGPGIAPEHHGRVFKLFQTLSPGMGTESTGLGLALVQKLAVSLGGQVTLTSDPAMARGTVFTIRLPKSPMLGTSANIAELSKTRRAA